ncbi:MAG: glutamate 5-kinase [Candidatus Pacebacteria bacterium]|nr:glutamate 5-kinase [Candidatus Paceibacterota bacterium]
MAPDLGKIIVIKIGSALLVDEAGEGIRTQWLQSLAADIAELRHNGQKQIVIVSSGAIAIGRRHLGLEGRALKLEEKQAAAATGQIRLAHAWQEALAHYDITVAQILLTLEDTEDRRRHLNGRATIQTLLSLGVVPVINENDTVATAEIRFGDNDRLAARVTQMLSADCLILFSDIDGLYTADPRLDSNAEFISIIPEITPEVVAMAGAAPVGYSSGGMVTKIAAAKIAVSAGSRMVIANGRDHHCLSRLMKGEARHSLFLPQAEPLTARKKWIAAHVKAAGSLIIDEGAVLALRQGKSLLPAGLVEVKGEFDRGDLVEIIDQHQNHIGRGLVGYDSREALAIKGLKTSAVSAVLGYEGRGLLLHRDDLVMESVNE